MADKTSAPAGGASESAAAAAKPGKGRLIAAVALCVAMAGGGYVLGGRSAAGSAAPVTTNPDGTPVAAASTVPPPPEIHEMVDIAPMNVNLAGGHYLRVAVSLGVAAPADGGGGGHGAAEEAPPFPTAPARDIIVATLSGADIATLATDEGRNAAKASLTEKIVEHYHGEVIDVFLTEFVMQ